MTRPLHTGILAFVLGFLVLSASMAQQPKAWSCRSDTLSIGKEPISATRFGNQKVFGFLGHPLGTVVRVTGFAVDGDDTRLKANAGKLILRVETVNGMKLVKPVEFKFHRAHRDVVKPNPRDSFDFYVHEYGEFDGVVEPPKEFGVEPEIVAHNGFYYRPQITIHKSLN